MFSRCKIDLRLSGAPSDPFFCGGFSGMSQVLSESLKGCYMYLCFYAGVDMVFDGLQLFLDSSESDVYVVWLYRRMAYCYLESLFLCGFAHHFYCLRRLK